MPYLPYGFVEQEKLDAEIGEVIRNLGPDVVRVRYKIGEDTTGDPAIYFRVILTDNAVRRENIRSSTRAVIDAVTERLAPLPRWGLFPYLKFRGESERTGKLEPEWS